MDSPSTPQTTDTKEAISFAIFLETIPPNQDVNISTLLEISYDMNSRPILELHTPELQLHCGHERCGGLRFYRYDGDAQYFSKTDESDFFFMPYRCSNCLVSTKMFAIAAKPGKKADGQCYKFGEFPQFGPPTSARLIKLIGPDRETFLRGRRCENQGLGIGAFVYYRRVVVDQKNRILDEVIKVGRRLSMPEEALSVLGRAKDESRFSESLSLAKNAIPESLLINGVNPLTILHNALSEGVHDMSDAECLEVAADVRVILGELADRLAQALKDEAELNSALSRLMSKPPKIKAE